MKKIIIYSGILFLILLIAIGLYSTNEMKPKNSASATISTPINANETIVTDPIVKDYINHSLQNWSSSDTMHYYLNEYKKGVGHVEVWPSKNKDVSIEISKIKKKSSDEYTHTVNITFAHRIVILDGKQKLNTGDTLTYKININQFGMPEALKDSNNQIIKLVKYSHKEE